MSAFDSKGAAATSAYNPHKIFQAAQRCMGDPSVVAKVLVELLGDCADSDVLMASAAGVLALYYGRGGLRTSSMTDFGKFAGELADELGNRDSTEVSRRTGVGGSPFPPDPVGTKPTAFCSRSRGTQNPPATVGQVRHFREDPGANYSIYVLPA